jgi:hypothetical protein
VSVLVNEINEALGGRNDVEIGNPETHVSLFDVLKNLTNIIVIQNLQPSYKLVLRATVKE